MLNTYVSATKLKETKPASFQDSIIFSVDSNYLPFAIFVANQILEIEPELSLDICICTSDISTVPEKFSNSPIRFVEIEVEGLNELPFGRLTASAYHRLFLPELFKDDYRYLIYLDADTFILRPFTKDLMSFIDNLEPSFSVAAATDICELQIKLLPESKHKRVENYVKKYHKYNHVYRNSGVLVFNIKTYLDNNTLNKVLNYAFENVSELQCHDQSALNGALKTDIAFLPFTYNWQIHKLTYELIDDYQPYIIHFIGEGKPWNTVSTFTRNYNDLYISFFDNEFKNRSLEILTPYEKRLKNPKYKNYYREYISKHSQRIKWLLTRDSSKMTSNKRKKIKAFLDNEYFTNRR